MNKFVDASDDRCPECDSKVVYGHADGESRVWGEQDVEWVTCTQCDWMEEL